jgi:hypothetical protein
MMQKKSIYHEQQNWRFRTTNRYLHYRFHVFNGRYNLKTATFTATDIDLYFTIGCCLSAIHGACGKSAFHYTPCFRDG